MGVTGSGRGDQGALRMDQGWGLGAPWGGRGGRRGGGSGGGKGCTFSNSSTTSMCTNPRTDSPLMWVIRSPARRPASWAGLPSSTLWGGGSGGSVVQAPQTETPAQLSQPWAPSKLMLPRCLVFPLSQTNKRSSAREAPRTRAARTPTRPGCSCPSQGQLTHTTWCTV